MDGVIDMEKARALTADRELWPRVRDFIWNFALQIDPSWREESKFPAGLDSPRIRRHILDTLGIKPCFHDFPADDGSRLLLLDAATLDSVAKWIGALSCADSLRLVTNGATVRELRQALPGVYPEVFGYTAYFKLPAKPAKTAGDVVSCGREMLCSALAGLPEPLKARFKFKMPRGSCDFAGKPGNGAKTLAAVLKLLKLKFPEAYAICCS